MGRPATFFFGRLGAEFIGCHWRLDLNSLGQLISAPIPAVDQLGWASQVQSADSSLIAELKVDDVSFQFAFVSLPRERFGLLTVTHKNLEPLAFALEDRNSNILEFLGCLAEELDASSAVFGFDCPFEVLRLFLDGSLSEEEIKTHILVAFGDISISELNAHRSFGAMSRNIMGVPHLVRWFPGLE